MSTLQADLSILWPALIAGILVVLSHVPLGQQVLARGIVFIDLAIAQVAGLGVIAAHVSGLGAGGWITQVAAAAAALVGALLLTWTERKRPEAQEALIGVLFVLASTAHPAARQRSARRRGSQGSARRPDSVGHASAARPRRHRDRYFPARLVPVSGAARPRRVLRAVCVRRDHLGAAGRRVSGIHDSHRAGGGHLPLSPAPPALTGLRAGAGELPRGAGALGRGRPALEPCHRVGDGAHRPADSSRRPREAGQRPTLTALRRRA